MNAHNLAKISHNISFKLGVAFVITFLVGIFPSLALSATFVSGISNPTGLAIHPEQRLLYINSGSSGTVWKVPINPGGTAGPISLVTNQFTPPTDIAFDASGNLYGVGDYDGDSYIYILSATGSVCRTDPIDYGNWGNLFPGIAAESPGFANNRLFFGQSYNHLGDQALSSVTCGSTTTGDLGSTCGPFRYLHYRAGQADLIGTYDDKLVSVNLQDASCSTLATGMMQPAGIAEDPQGNLYVADAGVGEIIKRDMLGNETVIATGLSGPSGLVFDSETGLLFVSETNAKRVTTLPTGLAPSGKIKLKIKNAANQWSTVTVLGPTQMSPNAPAACTDASRNLYVFISRLDNTLYMGKRSTSGAWTPWNKVPGSVKTASAPTAIFKGGKISLYARGLDDKIWEAIYTISTNTWGAWRAVPGLVSPSNPDATTDNAGNTYLLIRDMK